MATKNKKLFILGLGLFWLNSLAYANTDKPISNNTPAQFSAGSAECRQENNNTNTCTYRQNAQFIDKDTKLNAPTIIVYRDQNNQTKEIQAIGDNFGNKAYYHGIVNPEQTNPQKAKNTNVKNETPVDAVANIIIIYPPKNLMTLEGQAKVVRNQDIITGSYLEYDMIKQTILAKPTVEELTTILFQQRRASKPNEIIVSNNQEHPL